MSESSVHPGRLNISYGSLIKRYPCKLPQYPRTYLTSFVFTWFSNSVHSTLASPKKMQWALCTLTCTCLHLQMYHATLPHMPTPSFHLLPQETSTPNFQETPKATETIQPPHSVTSIICLCLTEKHSHHDASLYSPKCSAPPTPPSESKPVKFFPHPFQQPF